MTAFWRRVNVLTLIGMTFYATRDHGVFLAIDLVLLVGIAASLMFL